MTVKIKETKITVKELAKEYMNDDEEGVVGYDGKLNIRPPYQREFVYKDEERDAVIESVRESLPLGEMNWAVNTDGTYEIIDGQQRTVSICEYVDGKFSLNFRFFFNLTEDEKQQILNYELHVNLCEGNDSDKLKWFKRLNIAGVVLTNQEMRNASYTGEWLTDAKRHFSKTGCPAFNMGKGYMKGIPIRQDYLETTIDWISNGNIEDYMSKNQHKPNANELWLYFQNVINWVEVVFPNYRKEMKGVDFGTLYNQFKNTEIDSAKLETEIARLMQDEDVTKKAGIYSYVLTRNEKYLSIRAFTDNQKREAYEHQNGICAKCNQHFEIAEMEADHITPWVMGGKTKSENCAMLCKADNRTKSDT